MHYSNKDQYNQDVEFLDWMEKISFCKLSLLSLKDFWNNFYSWRNTSHADQFL